MALLAVGLLVVLLAGVAALHVPPVQRTLFARAAAALEERTGVRLAASSVRLRPFAVRLELIGPSLAAGAAEPFLTADSLAVELVPGSLVRGPLVLREVVLVGPRFDAARPLPPLGEAADGPAAPPAISIRSLRLRDGAAVGLAPPPALEPRLGVLTLVGLEADGELAGGELDLALRVARLRAAPPGDQPPLDLELDAELAGPLAGPLRLERLRIDGAALSGAVTGLLGLEEGQPLSAELDLEADAAALLGLDGETAPVRLVGEIDLRAPAGKLRIAAERLPGELASPWLEPELLASSGLSSSAIRLVADLGLRAGALDATAELGWMRGDRRLAAAKLAAAGELAAAELPIELDLELLPGAAGVRRLDARLLVSRETPAASRIERGRLRLDLPDLEAGLRHFDEAWPGWLPELPPGLAAGPLRAEGGFAGPVTDPALRLTGRWAPAPGASLDLRAEGAVAARRLDARVVLDALPLSRFVAGAGGTVAGTAEVALAGERLRGAARLEGLGIARDGLEVDRARLVATLDGRSVRIDELWLEQASRSLAVAGEIELEGTPAADLTLALTGGWGPLRAAEGRLLLAGGVARLEIPRADLAGEVASLAVSAPLATLSRAPGGESLAGLAGEGPGGPVEAEWQLPAIDWWAALGAGPAAEAAAGEAVEPERWVAGARGRLSLDPAAPAAGEAEVEILGLEIARGGRALRAPEGLRLELAAGRLRLAPSLVEIDGRPVRLSGEADLGTGWAPGGPASGLLEEARLTARSSAAGPLEGVDLALRLEGDGLRLAAEALLADGGRGRLQAAAPLASLRGEDGGEIELTWEMPAVDWSGWLGPVDEDTVLKRLVVGTGGHLAFDPARPASARGELRIPRFEVELEDQSLRAREPIELRLADGRLAIESAGLSASGAPLDLSGWVDLEPEWRPGAPPAELVRELALSGGGVVPAALLNPFLAGGAAEGALLAELSIAGPGGAVEGELELTGPGAGIYFLSPYSLEIAEPEVKVRLAGESATFSGGAQVNEGRLTFSGTAGEERGIEMEARLEEVRAVLDYGLLIQLDGDLRLTVEPAGTGLLAGTLTVDRGQLTRPIRLDSLLLGQLLPADLLGSELDPLEAIALDLSIDTRQGVRVKNNLADLKVRWQPIAVRGNLVQPILEGRLEVDPGGLVYAYGQTVRLDSAAVVYDGLPDEVPTLELQTTTSLEDPSIGRLAGNDPFAVAERRPAGAAGAGRSDGAVAEEALTSGLAAFVGEQLGSTLDEALGGAQISFRPLLIFGEADPGARLTASSDLSARVTLAASVDLRNAERQTYLLDLHDEQAAARLSAQLFTNDLGNEGGTLQQRLELGGTRLRGAGPRLRRLNIDPVPGVRRRATRRAVGYRKGDRLAEGAAFEISVAVGELLRQRGYPDARVRVEERPAPSRPGVVLDVRIDSGPHVEFRFTGEQLPRALRRSVAGLYRGDFYEPAALEEMRQEATRAWRSLGYLEPRITVEREPLPGGPPEQRLVTVDSAPGERRDLAPPRFVGLPAEASAELALLFTSSLRRAELAAGIEAAERRALGGLEALGYPDAAIVGRRLEADGTLPVVEVDPGERLRVAALEFADARGRRTEVGEAGGVRAGDPVRADRLSRAALTVERDLRAAGYLEAEVTVRLEPLGPERPADRRAVFTLDRGPLHRLGEAEFEGLVATRPAWARRTAGLEPGQMLVPAALRDARRRLFGSGLFSAVGARVGGAEEGPAQVLFEVEERPRYRVAYGVRWESEEGESLVLDLLDGNVLGRGIDLGLRALVSREFEEVRLSGSVPGLLGPKSRLDVFALGSEEERLVEDGEVLDLTRTFEGTVQLGWQLGPRTTGRVYARYRDVRFTETFLVEDPFFGPIDPIEVRVRQPFVGVQYIFDSRDDRVAPGRGLFASVDLSYSDESLGGDIRYGRIFGQLHGFRPAGRLAGRRLTWAQSVRLGRAEAFADQELLGDLLLRAGGEYSVRGYRRESLGPPALTGTVLPSVRENSLFVLNQELRFDLWRPLSGLVFFDAGNVWIENDIDLDLFTSLGLGLRADTPFGLLRLDLAWPLDRREEIDPEVKLYFGLGNVF